MSESTKLEKITIEKEIPIPKGRWHEGKHQRIRDALAILKINESFKVPYTKSIHQSILKAGKDNGIKVTTRHLGDEIRVWRIA